DYPCHNSGSGNDSAIDPSLKTHLIDHFRPHNRALFAHLGLDFGWPT
ncbi:MAG: sulfotransferase, partial [Oscillatoriales cyanobacterium]